jgi:hypothetical protein
MSCATHVCPVYPSPPVQAFHAHCTAVPTATVFDAGVNALFVTEIPPTGGGVFTLVWVTGLVLLPPHPKRHAIAIVVQACFNILISGQVISTETVLTRIARLKAFSGRWRRTTSNRWRAHFLAPRNFYAMRRSALRGVVYCLQLDDLETARNCGKLEHHCLANAPSDQCFPDRR